MSPQLSVSVVVPSYRRPDELARCITALMAQTRVPDQIVVVVRRGDAGTAELIAGSGTPQLRAVEVESEGVLAAMQAGVIASTGSVIAFTDDDAAPRRDWLERVVRHLDDQAVGAVGGRDVVHGEPDPGRTATVGMLTRWGKLRGNHHLGTGPARDVRVLKGVNMAFRREALALPETMCGGGAQPHFEIATCLWAARAGWRLVYDPEVTVDHYPGVRFDADQRTRPERMAIRATAYNLVTAMCSVEPGLLPRRALYGLVLGDGRTPGIGRYAVALARREATIARRGPASIAGQLAAVVDLARGRRLRMIPAPAPYDAATRSYTARVPDATSSHT
jgi:GT2 family glycosyltransferase